MNERKVIVIGSLNYDVCLKQERMPEEGESYFADSVEYCSGGKGANQAVQAAKLGLTTYLVGCVGQDSQAEFLKENVKKYGVHSDYIKTVEGYSGMSVAQSLYDGGARATVVKGANDKVTKEDVKVLDNLLNEDDIVVLQLEIPIAVVEYAINLAKKKKCFVILNGAPAAPLSQEALDKVDLFIVNEIEAAFYSEQKIDSVDKAMTVIKEFNPLTIFTLGKAGAVVYDGKNCEFIPSKKVKAVESTGAGDSFIGGLCYGLIRQMDIFEASQFATCCSALTVGKTGGQPAMPYLNEVMKIYGDKQ